jgi:DNA polymerase V
MRALMKFVDGLNAKYGRDVVRWGMFNNSGSWKTHFARRSPRYTTRWAEILAVVKLR